MTSVLWVCVSVLEWVCLTAVRIPPSDLDLYDSYIDCTVKWGAFDLNFVAHSCLWAYLDLCLLETLAISKAKWNECVFEADVSESFWLCFYSWSSFIVFFSFWFTNNWRPYFNPKHTQYCMKDDFLAQLRVKHINTGWRHTRDKRIGREL